MPILLYFFTFISIFFIVKLKYGLRETFVFTWLSFLFLTYVSTEFLSYFFVINFTTLVVYYTIILLVFICVLYKNNFKSLHNLFLGFKNISKNQYFIIGIPGLYFLILLFIGIYTTPNNWDSMTYHLGRVVHWQQNQNIEHYATHISRQLFNPPLVEYVQLHILILSGNDYFLNIIQLVSLIGCLLSLSLIMRELGYNLSTQFEICLLTATIPMAILQATNTKNELSVAFLFISSVYFLICRYNNKSRFYLALLGLSLGLSFATKSTSYIYLLPVLSIFFIGFSLKNFKQSILTFFIAVSIAILVASPIFIRSYKSYKNPIGGTQSEHNWVVNNSHNWKALVSNISRNSFIHLANMSLWGDKKIFEKNGNFHKKWVESLHQKLDIDINNPDTTFGNSEFLYNISRDEDYAGNFLHFILVLVSFFAIVICYKYFKINTLEIILMFSLISVSFFFCIYLKWQPWHSRLHVPIFIFSSIISMIFLSKLNLKLRYGIYIILVLGSITYLFENDSKIVLFKKPKIFNLTRDQMMFAKKGNAYLENLYAVSSLLSRQKLDTLGLIIDGDAWDYSIFKILKKENKHLIINHINVSSEQTPQIILDRTPVSNCDFILSNTEMNSLNLIYNNLKYELLYRNTDFSVFGISRLRQTTKYSWNEKND